MTAILILPDSFLWVSSQSIYSAKLLTLAKDFFTRNRTLNALSDKMSESGDSDVQTEHTHEQQMQRMNTRPLLSVHVDNMEVSQAEDNEDDVPDPGDQENNRRPRNRRVDSAMYEGTTSTGNVLIDGVLCDDTVRRRKHVPGPRRIVRLCILFALFAYGASCVFRILPLLQIKRSACDSLLPQLLQIEYRCAFIS